MAQFEDELQVRKLAAAYVDAVNRRCPEDMTALFAPDGEIVSYHRSNRPIVGTEAILKGCNYLLMERPYLYMMLFSGVVEVNGDSATDRWWFGEVKRTRGEDNYFYHLGVYQGEAVRLEDGWRYKKRFVRSDLFKVDLSARGIEAPAPPFFPIMAL